jgi:hypothetical protein
MKYLSQDKFIKHKVLIQGPGLSAQADKSTQNCFKPRRKSTCTFFSICFDIKAAGTIKMLGIFQNLHVVKYAFVLKCPAKLSTEQCGKPQGIVYY